MANMTRVPTRAGSLYLAAVLDAFSGRIAGWTMSPAQLVPDAMDMAIGAICESFPAAPECELPDRRKRRTGARPGRRSPKSSKAAIAPLRDVSSQATATGTPSKNQNSPDQSRPQSCGKSKRSREPTCHSGG